MARTDRALIGAAILILLLTLGALTKFDALFSRRNQKRGDVIAEIIKGEGDVRVKYKNEFHWQKANSKDGLVFDDAIFSGADAHVQMRIGESELNLDPNTLIVLRKDDAFRTLKMNYGSLKSVLAKNDKIFVESDGQRLELSSRAKSNVTITKKSGKMVIQVKSGAARVVNRGKVEEIAPGQPLVVEAPKRRAHTLEWTEPRRNTFYIEQPTQSVKFAWAYKGQGKADTDDVFTLELARDAEFKQILLQPSSVGEMAQAVDLARGQTYFARVSNTYGEQTPVKTVSVRSVHAPVITMPLAESELGMPSPRQAYPLKLTVNEVPVSGRVWAQVARDAEYKDLIYNQTSSTTEFATTLTAGEYYMRARNLYEDHVTQSAWSGSTHVFVRAPVDLEHLMKNPLTERIFIANRDYPKNLYAAADADVQKFVGTMEPLPHYFQTLKDLGLSVVVSRPRESAPELELDSAQFPTDWIFPGDVDVAYHLENRAGPHPRVEFQNSHRVQFVLEAPNRLQATPKGELNWSPVLFARGYEVQLREPDGATKVIPTHTAKARVTLAKAGAVYAFRVRALGRERLPITAWSDVHSFKTPAPVVVPPPPAAKPAPVEVPVAEAELPPPPSEKIERAPAQTLIQAELEPASWLHRLGAWVWAGLGYNVFDVRQTVSGTADIRYLNHGGPSTSIEAGFVDMAGVGAIFSYTRLPGNMQIDNINLDHTKYVWDQYAVEGVGRLDWRPHLLGRAFTVAFTGGAQYEHFPFLYVGSDQSVSEGNNSLLNASAGIRTESTGRFRYHLNLRYELPLFAHTEGGNEFRVSPIFAFDGSVGASYLINKAWQTGLFWYGQFQDFKFNYTASGTDNPGTQSLFYSAMELRLGYEF